jgi:AcrR family transcriptional regulator
MPSSTQAGREARPRRATYHHGNLREALMDGAVDLIDREGLRGFSLNAVARAVGVSTAAPYRHFASGEALLTAVVQRGWTEFTAALRATAEQHPDDCLRRLRALGETYLAFARQRPAVFRLLFDKRDRPVDRSGGRIAFTVLLDCVAQAAAQGLLRAPGDPVDVAHAAWALVHGLAMLHLGGDFEATRPGAGTEVGDRVLALFVDGIRTVPDGEANTESGG